MTRLPRSPVLVTVLVTALVTALATALATALILTGLLGGAASANAAAPGAAPGALDGRLPVKQYVWGIDGGDPAVGAIGIGAPRGWSLEVTKKGRGIFTDPTGTFDEIFDEAAGNRTVVGDQRRLVHLLGGAPGTAVISATAGTSKESAAGTTLSTTTVAFSYESAGRPKLTIVRFIAVGTDPTRPSEFMMSVSGRPRDADGLAVLLERATRKVYLSS